MLVNFEYWVKSLTREGFDEMEMDNQDGTGPDIMRTRNTAIPQNPVPVAVPDYVLINACPDVEVFPFH
jgi:hypothetical protein